MQPAEDPDDDAPEKGPLRRCIVTRESLPKEVMLRFVVGPGQVLVPDLAGRLPGRGMWLKAAPGLLGLALKKGAFNRAAKVPLHWPDNLPAQLSAMLEQRLADTLGMARRAGQSVAGWQKVQEWLQAGRVGLLVEATDGSAAERARLIGRSDVRVVLALPAEALGQIFGRGGAVHVAVAKGRLAETVAVEAERLRAFSTAA
ncbi:MAG: RNA-binding protein [Rubritepida sp.]|nr:RNA-binding protein [Rubritepida sp.]